jgi:hypothetical protein
MKHAGYVWDEATWLVRRRPTPNQHHQPIPTAARMLLKRGPVSALYKDNSERERDREIDGKRESLD